jgi:hypothetical protein
MITENNRTTAMRVMSRSEDKFIGVSQIPQQGAACQAQALQLFWG